MYFNIHGLYKIQIEGDNKRILNYFKEDLAYFLTEDETDPDLKVIVSDFDVDLSDCFIVEQNYYIKKNFIYSNDSRKMVKWKYLIEDIENKPTVYFSGNFFSEIFLREFLIEPIMAFKLAEKGYYFLHGSGIAFDNKGIVFTASKGVGKTTTLLNFIEEGATCLSNEPIIISEGKVYSFPARIRLYYYNFKGNSSFWKKLYKKQRLEVIIKYLAYRLSLKFASFSLNVDPSQLFDKVGGSYPLRSLLLLNKSFNGDIEIQKNIDRDILVKKLVTLNKFELFYFEKILNAYTYIFPNVSSKFSWEVQENGLKKVLSNISCNEINVPFSYSSKVYETILNLVNEDLED